MNIFVARQAILNTKRQVVAYELLFRNGFTNYMDGSIDGSNATQNIVANSLIVLGINTLTGGKRAFINFTAHNITSGIVELLPKKLITIEILEDVLPSQELINACKNLRKLGYTLVLDDFVFRPNYKPLIDLADMIKVDFLVIKTPHERKRMREIIPPHIKLLAEKVETEEDYKQAIKFGYEYFQGYFFSKPEIITRKALSTTTVSQLLLIQEINRSDFNVASLEKIIKHDLSLSYKLLKYINSPVIGIKTKISSIKQAITLLGLMGIRNWANIVSLRELSLEKMPELFTISLLRAKFCELLAKSVPSHRAISDTAFLVGIFSLLDTLLDRSMATLLSEIKLSTEIEMTLLGKNTKLTPLLTLIIAYEEGNWLLVDKLCTDHGFPQEKLLAFYQQALSWADQIAVIPHNTSLDAKTMCKNQQARIY